MALLASLAVNAAKVAGGLAFGSWAQRFWRGLDPSSPYAAPNEALSKMMQIIAEAETARVAPVTPGLSGIQAEWGPLDGLDQIVASERIRQMSAEERLDLARMAPSEDRLREFLGFIQRQAIEQAKENPESISYATPWKVAWAQLKRGSFLSGVEGVTEAVKRNLDQALSNQVGFVDSFGRNLARSVGIKEDDALFGPISGTLDMGAVILGDPLLIVGKGAKIARAAMVEGRVVGPIGTAVTGTLGASVGRTAEGRVYTDTANWAVRMPGVRNWAKKVASESDNGVVGWYEHLGGGIIDDDAVRQAIASSTDPDQIQRILANGLRTGAVQRLPIWGRVGRNRLALMARTQYINYGARAWNEALELDDPAFSQNFFILQNFLFGNKAVATERGRHWLSEFFNADPKERINVTRKMLQEGLDAKAKDITAAQAKKLASRAGVKAKTWDELGEKVTDGTDDVLRDRAKAMGLDLPEGVTGEELKRTVRESIELMPRDLSKKATENVETYAGGFFSQHAKAYGYHPNHGSFELPMFETQLENQMSLPSYQSLFMWQSELGALASKKGWASKKMSSVLYRTDQALAPWRGLITATPKTTMKNVMDDNLAMMGHPEWGGRFTRRLAYGAWDLVAGSGFPGRPFFRFVGKSARPGKFRDGVEKAALDIPVRDRKRFQKAFGDKWEEYARPSARTSVSSTWNRNVGFGQAIDRTTEESLNARSLSDADWNIWAPVHRGDMGFPETYHHFVNHQVLQDQGAKHILANLDEPERAAAMLREFAEGDFGKVQRQLATKQGMSVEEFAKAKSELIDFAIPKELRHYARDGGYIPPEAIQKLWKSNPQAFPEAVTGPVSVFNSSSQDMLRMIGSAGSPVGKAVSWYHGVAGAMMDKLGRNPAFREAFLSNYDLLTAQAKKLAKEGVEVSEEVIASRARRAAERQLLELAENMNERTRLAIMSRGFLAFADSHFRFWKRWARVAVRNPTHVEKIRLLFGAGESLGWIEPDERGNLVFTLPIAPQLAAAMLPGDKDLWKSYFSVTVGKATQVLGEKGPAGVIDLATNLGQVVAPKGLPFSVDVIPGFSPVVSFPVDYFTRNMPSFREVADRILGPTPRYDPQKAGFADSVVNSFIPAWTRDIFRIFEDEDHDVIKAQAVSDALRFEFYNFAEKHGRNPATPEEAEEVYEAALSKANMSLVVKVLARLFSPYSQSRVPYGKEIAEDWYHLRARHGGEIGFKKFMEKYGEGAILYTVPTSKVENGAPINYSEEAEKFYLDNPELFRDFPQVAGFFTRDMPGFELDVLGRMKSRGERSWVPPKEILAEGFYRLGNQEYYEKVRPQYLAMLAGAVDKQQRDELSIWLEGKRNEIDEKYPGWKRGYAAASSNSQMRELSIAQLRLAVQHPKVQDLPGTEAVKRFLSVYDQALAEARSQGFSTIGGVDFLETRRSLAAQAAALAATSGSEMFRSVYEYMFRPMLERLEDEYIQQKAA